MNQARTTDHSLPGQIRAPTAAEAALAEQPGSALATAYEETHTAILAIVDGLGDRQLTTVPACPAWTIRDLLAHMTGVAADAITARFPVVNPHGPWGERQAIIDAFTAGHVTSRQDLTLKEVLVEWADHVLVLATMLRGEQNFPVGSIPIINWMVVCDIAAHHHDLCRALQTTGDRESAAVSLSLQRYIAGLSQRIAAAGLPALRLRTEHNEYIAGNGPPATTLATPQWELFRALCSRRSPAQIRALRWTGDAEPYMPLLPAYGLPSDDLIE